jgi:hypothetical protein
MRVAAWRRAAAALVAVTFAFAPAAIAAPPAAPTNVHQTGATVSSLFFAWDAPTDPSVTGGGGSLNDRWATYLGGSNSITSAGFGYLTCGTTYTVTAQFMNSDGWSAGSTAQGTTDPCTKPPPAPPTGLSATATSPSSITLGFDQPDASILRYSLTATGPLARGETRNDLSSVPPAADGLVCGQTYQLRLAWIDDEGLLSDPATVSGNTADCSTLPARPAPTGLTASPANGSPPALALHWDLPPTGVVGWRQSVTGPGLDSTIWHRGDQNISGVFRLACGSAYTASIAFVYSDGGLSDPATVVGTTDACPAASTPPPASPPPPPRPDTIAPRIKVGPKNLGVSRTGKLVLGVRCPASETVCSGDIGLKRAKRVRHLPSRCGGGGFQLHGFQEVQLTIKLPRACFAVLRGLRSLPFLLTVNAQDGVGNKRTQLLHVRLFAPPVNRRSPHQAGSQ